MKVANRKKISQQKEFKSKSKIYANSSHKRAGVYTDFRPGIGQR